jgi:hypothetical protein
MIFFVSESFLRRLQLLWKPALSAFLIGQRNLFFFVPDSLIEVESISPKTIDEFLAQKNFSEDWQLLGFLTAHALPQFPGYARVETNGQRNPAQWKAVITLLDEGELRDRLLEIRQTQSATMH